MVTFLFRLWSAAMAGLSATAAAFRASHAAKANRASPDSLPDPFVEATVHGQLRRVQLMSTVGLYHVHCQAVNDGRADGGKVGFYVITEASVVPKDKRKFRAFVEWYSSRYLPKDLGA